MLILVVWAAFVLTLVGLWICTRGGWMAPYLSRKLRVQRSWIRSDSATSTRVPSAAAEAPIPAQMNQQPNSPAGLRKCKVVVPAGRVVAVVFINTKSGGQLGVDLLRVFQKVLDASVQVFDLSKTPPSEALQIFKDNPKDRVRILCCGGDGTVGWVLTACRAMNLQFPTSVLPLGTGNDLSRALGWGAGISSVSRALVWKYLAHVYKSNVEVLDQWQVTVKPKDGTSPRTLTMNNYFSIGIDAEVALRFHEERKRHPERFTSQTKNVVKYAMLGLEGAFAGCPLGSSVELLDISDNGATRHPYDVNELWKGIIISNVPCYQGGKKFWGDSPPDDSGRPFFEYSIQDKRLEVMALSGTLHIGLVHLAMDSAIQLGQSSGIELNFVDDLVMQVDGEPWAQRGPCSVSISFIEQRPMLRPRMQL